MRNDAVTKDIGAKGPALQRVVGEPGAELHGFVVIDNFVSGRGTGGVRCTESVSLDEVARLAHEMTLKFAFLHLPSGGAKAGLVARPGMTADERQDLFRRFGEAISDLIQDGKYVGGLDMGSGPEDINALHSGAGVRVLPEPDNNPIDSNYFTALTVYVSIQALMEKRGRSLQGTSVLVEGVGKVGTHLLRLLGDAGARVVGVSTLVGAIYRSEGLDIDALIAARAEHGDSFVENFQGCEQLPAKALFLQDGDVLVPGGGPDSLNGANVDKIKARWIVPVANICALPNIEEALFNRGIEYIPGFVSNSGGVFCWYLGRLSSPAREDIIRDRFKARIKRLVTEADQSGRSIPDTARNIAERNLSAMQSLDDGNTTARIAALGHKLSPFRLAYVVGSRILGQNWRQRPGFLLRNYYDSRYFS